jgi:glutathione/glutaredoxin type arsenate reductase
LILKKGTSAKDLSSLRKICGSGMKKVLFVCVENSCRSQMAEGFAKKLGQGRIEASSAGSNPSGKVEEMAIQVMKEKGIDISGQRSKGFDDLKEKDFDYVITMGCGDVCPFVPAKERIEWDVSDPKGKSIEAYREIRDTIERKLQELIKNL